MSFKNRTRMSRKRPASAEVLLGRRLIVEEAGAEDAVEAGVGQLAAEVGLETGG